MYYVTRIDSYYFIRIGPYAGIIEDRHISSDNTKYLYDVTRSSTIEYPYYRIGWF